MAAISWSVLLNVDITQSLRHQLCAATESDLCFQLIQSLLAI